MLDNSYTTHELAAMLDRIQSMPSSRTEYFKHLDEMVMRLALPYPSLEPKCRDFSAAREAAWGVSEESEKWTAFTRAAEELTIMVRTLGNIPIKLCEKYTQHGMCRIPLTPTGECKGIVPHRT